MIFSGQKKSFGSAIRVSIDCRNFPVTSRGHDKWLVMFQKSWVANTCISMSAFGPKRTFGDAGSSLALTNQRRQIAPIRLPQ